MAERGEDESARLKFERAIATLEADGDAYARPYAVYGEFLFGRWHTARALSYAGRALEINPDCTPGHLIVGGALFRMERYDEAYSHYKRALELDPNEAAAHINEAWVYAERGAFVEAERRYERAFELVDDDPLLVTPYAHFHDVYSDDGEAERWFRQALTYGPDCLHAHKLYLDFLVARGRIDDTDCERILIRARPEDEPVLICLWSPETLDPVETVTPTPFPS